MKTIKQFRIEGDKNSPLKAKLFQTEYPELYDYINDAHTKVNRFRADNMTMGCSYGMYRDLTRHILGLKPKHIIEYGPGFTTILLHKISQMVDWKMEVYSYEDDERWFNILNDNGFNPFGTMELVELEVVEKDNIYFCEYKHDLTKHKDVDYVLVDGPGIVVVDGVRRDNINVNLEVLSKSFNKKIQYDIDGRHNTQVYYRRLFENSDESFVNVPM